MDRLAEKLGMDPWNFRRLNIRKSGDPGPLGQPIAPTDGADQVWSAIAESPLWREKLEAANPAGVEPWLKTGIGAALVMHGAGLGVGIPDVAGGRLELASDGKIEAVFGYEEFGQGLLATLELMLIEQFGFAADDIRILIGDTDIIPDSGSSTASRATSMMWKSLQNMRQPFVSRMLEEAGRILHMPPGGLTLGYGGIYACNGEKRLLSYGALATYVEEPIKCETRFHYPTSPVDRVGAHYLYTFAAVAVKAEVNTLTGRVRILTQFHSVAAGPVMNPQGFLGQIEGGSGMAHGYALTEEALMVDGLYVTKNLDTYLIPTIADLDGRIEVFPIEDLPEGDRYGPRGIGEVGSVGLAPAIAAAVFDATGKWITRLPIDRALLLEPPIFHHKAVNVP
jgi:CO/xanthine dehydrogenase Mo-binding subunit